MKHKASRRKFIKGVGLGTIASSFFPAALLTNSEKNQDKYFEDKENSQSPVVSKNYSGEYLNRVAFPVGGMGAGMFCVEGTGAISHMSVRNKPDVFNEPAMFAALAIKGITNGAKVIEGPVPDWKKFGQLGSGNGSGSATTGLPRFHKAVFNSKFPFATIQLSDSELPVKVELTAWSPFIPTDENNSSLPVGALAYRITNTGSKTIDAVFSYNSVNFLKVDTGKNSIRPFHNGFILSENGTKEKPFLKSDFAIFSDDENTIVDHSWFRGGWFDPLTIAWESIKNAEVKSVPP